MALRRLRAACVSSCLLAAVTGHTSSCDPHSEACAAEEADTDQALLQLKKSDATGEPLDASLLDDSVNKTFDCLREALQCQGNFECLGHVEATCANALSWFPDAHCNGTTNKCRLASIKEPTMVYPGGDTGCLDGSPYGFYVQPGKYKDRLVMNFQGGGACFSPTVAGQACTRKLTFGGFAGQSRGPKDKLGGIFCDKYPGNAWRDYTIIQVMYCSGDVHVGNTTQPDWPGSKPGNPVRQLGYFNALSVVSWIKANFKSIEHLVVSGESAGAIGAQTWADYLLHELKYSRAFLVADSNSGVVSPDGEDDGPFKRLIGLCDLPLLEPLQKLHCTQEKLTWQEIFLTTMEEFPNVEFRQIQSKYDLVQLFYYNLEALDFNYTQPIWPTQKGLNEYYALTNDYFTPYYKQKNYQVFLVNSIEHQFLHSETFYTTTAAGVNKKKGIKMSNWVFKEQNNHQCVGGEDNGQLPLCNLISKNCIFSWCDICSPPGR